MATTTPAPSPSSPMEFVSISVATQDLLSTARYFSDLGLSQVTDTIFACSNSSGGYIFLHENNDLEERAIVEDIMIFNSQIKHHPGASVIQLKNGQKVNGVRFSSLPRLSFTFVDEVVPLDLPVSKTTVDCLNENPSQDSHQPLGTKYLPPSFPLLSPFLPPFLFPPALFYLVLIIILQVTWSISTMLPLLVPKTPSGLW